MEEKAAQGLSEESLKARASTEFLLLDTYGVKLPPRPQQVFDGPVDPVSVRILELLHPIVLGNHKPLKIVGDGNCFFRAVSRVLYGTEEHHLMIRLLSCVEMANNPSYYDASLRTYKDLINDNRIVLGRYVGSLNNWLMGLQHHKLHIF